MSYPTLKIGATGAQVRYLQTLLGTVGYSVAIDGIFGAETDNAVRTFQSTKSGAATSSGGLWANGIVAESTWRALGVTDPARIPAPTKIIVKTDPASGLPAEVEVPKPPLVKATNAGLGAVTVLLWFLGWKNTAAIVSLVNVGDIAARQLSPGYAKATEPLMGYHGVTYRRGYR